MKKMRFKVDDLGDRAALLLADGDFIATKRKIFHTFALYELYGHYVEVIVSRDPRKKFSKVLSIEFLNDTNVLAGYVSRKFFRNSIIRELCKPEDPQ